MIWPISPDPVGAGVELAVQNEARANAVDTVT